MTSDDCVELPLLPQRPAPSTGAGHVGVWQWPCHGPLDDDRLRDLFLRHGRHTPQHVPGAFAFLIHDAGSATALAARDAVGTRPLYFQQTERSLRVSRSLTPFADRARFAAAVDLRWIAAYLEGIGPDAGATAFQGVRELLPGEFLHLVGGRVEVARWHTFNAPPHHLDHAAAEAVLGTYRDAVYSAANVGSRPASVELGISLASRTLLTAATHGRPAHDPNLWGVGFANFDRVRDLVLDEARGVALAGADVITGWPGRMTAWNRWYRAGAVALGQPAYHGDLTFQALLETLPRDGQPVLLAGADDTAFGWDFRPALAGEKRQSRRGLMGSSRGKLGRIRRAVLKRPTTASAWTPGPLLNPAAAADLGLHDLAESDRLALTQPSPTGYASLRTTGLTRARRERLATWFQLARQQGVEVVFPLFTPEALHALLALPRALNDLDGHPGGAARAILGTRAEGIDWAARRWPGVERPKTAEESRANGAARRRYLRENLHPALEPLLNLDRLRPLLESDDSAPRDHPPSFEQRRKGAVEFAHIEATNHWLSVWGIK